MKLIDVYPYKRTSTEVHFLILKRSNSKIYAGDWRMVGGKVKQGESAWQTALRELKEETQLSPILFWTVPSINQFYDFHEDIIHQIPVFACEIESNSEPVLNDEHIDFKWVTIDEITQYIQWPEQIRLMQLIHHLLKKTLHPTWIIS